MLIPFEAATLALFALLSTNVDNLLLVVAWHSGKSARLISLLFLTTMMVVVFLAFQISLAVDYSSPPFMAWVGVVPLGMGLYELIRRNSSQSTEKPGSAQTKALALIVTLLANSGDTLVIQATLFTDLATPAHVAGMLGSFLGALSLAVLAFIIMSSPGKNRVWLERLSRVRPWLLMVIGILILMDTDFDIV